ncbi:hypothetical protein [Paenibacillus harenae]|uniref:Ferritin-like domain-containing protein n=1 Tax=Paenibacillus harenae TaxID=306543 RepID=A0ABT9UA50_PAEHA|nr:hypothetical protein [Paenibacillus harenae]MDQ0116510.1 hypothetical protein [Paenibacillus harenae]
MDENFTTWTEYFIVNKQSLKPIYWDDPYKLDPQEYATIARSIQQFQIGESSEGKYLIESAKRYLSGNPDKSYLQALIHFVHEEQRHAQDLALFMHKQNIPTIRKHWVDQTFRKLRRFATLEQSITVLLTAEIIAAVYYDALKESTKSRTLIELCEQILGDESMHIKFQSDALRQFARKRSKGINRLIRFSRLFLLYGTMTVVWFYHGKVFRAGGYSLMAFIKGALAEHDRSERIIEQRTHRP